MKNNPKRDWVPIPPPPTLFPDNWNRLESFGAVFAMALLGSLAGLIVAGIIILVYG